MWQFLFLRWVRWDSSHTHKPPFAAPGTFLWLLLCSVLSLLTDIDLLCRHWDLCPHLCHPSLACECPQQCRDVTCLQPLTPLGYGGSTDQLLVTLNLLLQSSAQREVTLAEVTTTGAPHPFSYTAAPTVEMPSGPEGRGVGWVFGGVCWPPTVVSSRTQVLVPIWSFHHEP